MMGAKSWAGWRVLAGTVLAAALAGCGTNIMCPATYSQCAGVCIDTQHDPANCGACGTVCTADQSCNAGKCSISCGGGDTLCGTTCSNTMTDPNNCGTCGTACTGGQVCSSGKCTLTCVGGTTLCGTTCVSTQTDPANCGACNNTCPTGQVCSSGKCGLTCVGGTTLCNNNCVNAMSDPSNCGSCGVQCTAGQVCTGGACSLTCGGGTTLCGSACANTQNDSSNCGSCGNACPNGQVCSSGKCGLSCVGGTTLCNNNCVNTMSDPANCGSCGTACAAGKSCASGQCVLQCVGGTMLCGSTCVNLQLDPANCGACGNTCSGGKVCSSGQCALQCVGGTTLCSGACVSLQGDSSNCGACGTACASGKVCVTGGCCQVGQAYCSGTCTVLQTDPNNCGTCGTQCPSNKPVCIAGACSQATNCKALLAGGANTDGLYTIQPDSTQPAFQTYCDMTSAGGGWTLVMSAVQGDYQLSADASNQLWQQTGLNHWADQQVFGNVTQATNSMTGDYKNPAYWLYKGTDIMVLHVPVNTGVSAWKSTAIYGYNTTNAFLSARNGTLYNVFHDYCPLTSVNNQGNQTYQCMTVPTTYFIGTANALWSEEFGNSRNENTPGGITLSTRNGEGYPFAFCPVQVTGYNCEHTCIGGNGTTGGRGSGGWGNFREWYYDNSTWGFDSKMRGAAILIFVR